MRKGRAVAVSAVVLVLGGAAARINELRAQGTPPPPISFNREILPILANNCFACHGPDEKKRETKFHFDTQDGMFLKRGVIEPGHASDSLLVEKITEPNPKDRMPPPDSGHSLTEKQIDLLRRWIDEGAKWDTHWAYVPPKRSELPPVRQTTWVRNPIDQFILARLEREGLAPSPEAAKDVLLRRLTYELTGLPPTPQETDAFLADASPDAYEKQVDRLLGSPHYGERMAMPWLDAARYADTHGYHIDSLRAMWPWRDWVINAFNHNMPFDEFAVEQLAGDLLPNATREQKIASGFNRNHMINFEGGAIADEYQVEYVVDRVEATSNAFMGLTMGCARCHSHKFDPITHKEFYEFFAFFNTVPEVGLNGRTGNAVPVLPLPNAEQQARLDQLNAAIDTRREALADTVVAPLQEEWETSVSEKPAEPDVTGLVAHYELDGNFSDISGRYQHGRTVVGDPTFDGGQVGRAASFHGDTEVSFGNVGVLDREPFSLAVWLKGRGNLPISVFEKIDSADRRRGYEWRLDDITLVGIQKWAARLTVRIAGDTPEQAIEIRTRERLRLGDWYHVALTYDGSSKASGLTLYLNGVLLDTDIVRDALSGTCATGAPLRVGSKTLGRPFVGQLDDLRLYSRALTPQQVEDLAIHHPVRVILSGVIGKPSKEDAERTRAYFLTYAAPESLRTTYRELNVLQSQKDSLVKQIPTTMVMSEMKKPRDTFILARGDYRNQTDKVQPGVPAMLPPLPKDAPLNRLTLAKWLVDPAHPLTARVAVNRYWQNYFGYGIVKTQEDFGVQGEPPTHPELLDWLATEFIRTGWDVKAMQRLIVTSATYRQSSKVTPALVQKDPENRLLARGPRIRLSAEMIRDQALAASGLLVEQVGGPSLMPYQPPGLWTELTGGDDYKPGKGADLYRRSLYTFWKRTIAPPAMLAFDASTREFCTVRETRTNTPLQALALLNEQTFVEATREFARSTLASRLADDNSRLRNMFQTVTSREP